MRAAILRRFDPETSAEILVDIEEIPTPRVAGSTDVLVRVAGAGVCRSDLHLVAGEPIGGHPAHLPHILGHENAGWVAETGKDVRSVSAGDPVLCYPFLSDGRSLEERYGLDSRAPERKTPGITAPGGYAEYLLVGERSLIPLPEGVDPAPLAPLADAGLAAYRACRKVAGLLRPGSKVGIIGVGGLGHIGIQVLRALTPATVIASDPRQEARSLGTAVGADAVCGAGEAFEACVGEMTAGRGLDAVIDFVGSTESAVSAITALATGGTLVVVGVGGMVGVPAVRLVEKELGILGSFVGTYSELWEVTRLVLDGRVDIEVDFYPLAAASQALHDLARGEVVGRAVLMPTDPAGDSRSGSSPQPGIGRAICDVGEPVADDDGRHQQE